MVNESSKWERKRKSMHHSIRKSLTPGGIRLTNAAKFFLLMLHFSFKYKVSYLNTFDYELTRQAYPPHPVATSGSAVATAAWPTRPLPRVGAPMDGYWRQLGLASAYIFIADVREIVCIPSTLQGNDVGVVADNRTCLCNI